MLSQFGVTPSFYQRDARRQFDRVLMDVYENQSKQPVLGHRRGGQLVDVANAQRAQLDFEQL